MSCNDPCLKSLRSLGYSVSRHSRYQRFELLRDEAALERAPAPALVGEGPFVSLLDV